MIAVINPKTGIYKEITEDNYNSDRLYLEKDGFRKMTDKEVTQHFGYKPYKPKPEVKVELDNSKDKEDKSGKPINLEDKEDYKTAKNKSKTANVT